MARYLGNAFSLNMVKSEDLPYVRFVECPIEEVKEWVAIHDWESCVGHLDTANVLTNLLGVEIAHKRTSITLNRGDSMIVGQCKGDRLEEGATTLPEGAVIQWIFVGYV